MEVRYRGFTGTVVYDMDLNRYKILAVSYYGQLVKVEVPLERGSWSTADICKKLQEAVDAILDDNDGDIIPEGGDDDET